MVNLSGPPYRFDFLETIVGINFPSGGYIILDITSRLVNALSTPGACPTVTLQLGAGEELIDRRETCNKSTIPGSTQTVSVYYIWNPIAPFPTQDNFYDVVLDAGDPVGYGTQMAKVVNMGSGFLNVSAYGPQLGGQSGVWDTFAEAQAYADLWNDRFVGGLPYTQTMFARPGDFASGSPTANVYSIDSTTVTPPASTSAMRGLYLVKVPKALTSLRVLTTGATDNPEITVKGYHGPTPPRIANVNPNGYDTQDTGGGDNITVTSRVDKTGPLGADFTTVTATGGGSGGAG